MSIKAECNQRCCGELWGHPWCIGGDIRTDW